MITVPGVEKFDISAVVANPLNVLLAVENGVTAELAGAIIFIWREPGIYEVHTNFRKSARGRFALDASIAAYHWMFTHTDCVTLLTRVPAFNRAAEWFCAKVGATREFERKAVWPTKNGPVDMSYWSLRYDDWVRKADGLVESGHMFHVKSEQEYARLGEVFPGHPEDQYHDRMAGACTEMIYGGQLDKAIILYNRYAQFAGYPPIRLIARDPLVIDTGDAVLQVLEHDFKLILCRSAQ